MQRINVLWPSISVSILALTSGCAVTGSDNAPLGVEEEVLTESQSLTSRDRTDGDSHRGVRSEERRVSAILARLTLAEKAGQMVQAVLTELYDARDQVGVNGVKDLNLGSVLSGGDSQAPGNTPRVWHAAYDALQADAYASSAKIPIIYGIDAVHGNSPVLGATIFPHNIGLGAARDPHLAYSVARTTARELVATGLDWTFAPCVTVSRDERWGRAYESFGETPELQQLLAAPQVWGFQGLTMQGTHVVATAKHFLADGGGAWGTGCDQTTEYTCYRNGINPLIDRGDAKLDFATLKAIHAKGYEQAIRAGVGTVMNSFSSVNGIKMSEHKELLTDYLKGDRAQGGLGFEGFVVSDWNSIDEIPVTDTTDPAEIYKEQVIRSIAAGVDMLMVSDKIADQYRFILAHRFIQEGVTEGKLTQARVDDAVKRILTIKMKAGLFEKFDGAGRIQPAAEQLREDLTKEYGSPEHRELARKAVQKSLVLLKNQHHTLPITERKYDTLYVVGKNADNFGADCGGWTFGWQGFDGDTTEIRSESDRSIKLKVRAKTELDHTILDGIKSHADANGMKVVYSADGQITVESTKRALAVAVVGENAYAEYRGDATDLVLDEQDLSTLDRVYATDLPVAVVLVSGRPRIVTDEIARWNAFVAAWLPGSQADGVADVLFGDVDFTGRLPMTWPTSMDQIPINVGDGQKGLFDYGFGLNYGR